MSEYILNVDDEGAAHQIIDKFGIEETKVYGYSFTGEEIVRCGNCKYLNDVRKCPCGFWALENLNGFCAWGERRKKDEGIETEDES